MTTVPSVPGEEVELSQSPEQSDEKRYWPFLDPKMVGKEIETEDGGRYRILAVFSTLI